MASFRIHEDQENRRPEIRQKDTLKAPFQQKRTVLGVLDNKTSQFVQKSKQVPPKVFGDFKIFDENAVAKQVKKPVPVVPVAQFEAFKVYEDKQDNKENPVKPQKPKVTEIEHDEIDKNILEISKDITDVIKAKNDLADIVIPLPMSIDKSITKTLNSRQSKNRQERDIFFEMPEYRENIHKYLREAELRNRPKAGYMKKQPDITYSMRTILVDWLVEVAEEYRLQTETLYLAVSYIDRFLSYMSVVRGKLQLVGTAAMFIASKYEEIYPPDVGEFVYITDDTYNKKQVLRMEQLILKVLAFDLSIPTPLTFLTKYCVASDQNDKTMHLAMYLCELSMLDVDPYLKFLPSMLAASSIYIARETLELEPWSPELEDVTCYTAKHLESCVKFLQQTYVSASTLAQQAIQEKYKSSKYQHVALILPESTETATNE